MGWFKVDDHFTSHPVTAYVGDEALGYWMRLGCWLAQFPDQGDLIPRVIAEGLDRSKRSARRKLRTLVEAGLLDPDGDDFRMHATLDICGSGLPDRAWDVERTDRERRAHISRTIRAEVYRRDGHACVECGTDEHLSLDHIFPWSKGGSDEIENLRTLCRSCNSRKGARV